MSLNASDTVKILLDTVWRFLRTIIFSLVHLVYVNVQQLYWRLNGTLRQVEKAAHPENYERSVQVLDIFFHHSFDWTLPVDIGHFLLVHNRFETPSYILDNDHVTLLTITETHAVFAEARDRNAHLWKTEYGGFFSLAQIKHSSRLLLVPLEAFHRMSEIVGDPSANLVFLHSTGRCGSTLVVQMLNATDKIVAISEPDAYNVLWCWQFGKKIRTVVPTDQLYKDVIRLICRPYKTIRPLVYLVKFPSYHARNMRLYQDLFPSSKQLFMYRVTLSTMRSQFRMMMGMATPRMQIALMPVIPNRLNKYILRSYGVLDERFFNEDDLNDKRLYGLGLLVEAIVNYLESRQKGLDIRALRYEDIVADPTYACERILEFCGAPTNLAERAVRGMKDDAQRFSPLARTTVGRYRLSEFDPEFREKANRLLRKHGLPAVDEELLLEGTITQSN